jgi:UDP-4-amino-4,6-dideoxy-N-acetyl-beta-L-altrosamine N-acetyltransferase
MNMQNPFIVGDKIYLRPIEVEDIDSFILWLNDEDVRQYLYRTSPLNKIREKEFVENLYKEDKDIVLGIVIKEEDKLIGNIGMHRISIPHRQAGLGIFIGNKDQWSKGYGTEALNLMLDYAFNQINLHRVYLSVMSFNARAIRAYEKVGFKREGIFREHVFRNGKYHDLYYMGVLENEWRELNGTGKAL